MAKTANDSFILSALNIVNHLTLRTAREVDTMGKLRHGRLVAGQGHTGGQYQI